MIVTVVAISGWLCDAMREWRETEHGHHEPARRWPRGRRPLDARPWRRARCPHSAAAVADGRAGVIAVEPPPGVHMPGPSPWPFFAPIAMAVMLFGVIFSSVLILGGLILASSR